VTPDLSQGILSASSLGTIGHLNRTNLVHCLAALW
jgi:hypothetical protein